MKKFKKIAILLDQIGVNPVNAFFFLRGLPVYIYQLFKAICQSSGWAIRIFPILTDKYKEAGSINSQYFIQDLYFASIIFKIKPIRHVDIGSRIDGFISHLLVFMEVDILDIRPIKSGIKGLNFRQVDIMSKHGLSTIDKYPSVSCLHTIEHFGLGRYGDGFNLQGWKAGLENILGLVEYSGFFYLSTPIGRRRIEFNAHRVFDPKELIEYTVSSGFKLVSFEFLDDANIIKDNLEADFSEIIYGCGFFVFQKI
ncbi:MAG: DUF268 domain-containing protein [Lutibacter sp.]|nr:DUF268 domain-containing protein [Lutibacter sp.]